MDIPDIESLANEIYDGESEAPQEPVEALEVQEEVEQPQVQEVETTEPEESFTKVDPNALSDELKVIYKQLQADYTKKRQVEAEKVRKLEKKIEEMGKPQEPQDPQELSLEDRTRQVVREENDSLWEKQAQADYPALDPRLNENDPLVYDEILDAALRLELTTKLDEYVEEHDTKVGFDYKNVSKEFVEKWDKYIESLNKAYIKKQTQIAKENADKLKKQAPVVRSSEGVKTGKMKIDDAINAALDES
jgi:hypothetical protein